MEYTFAPAGMSGSDAAKVGHALQQRLDSLIDLTLTLKHIHWNLVGPGFIGVHELMDVQVVGTRLFVDAIAERIATLGGTPQGVPGGLVSRRTWDDYSVGRDVVAAHLGALDRVYDGVVADHRRAIDTVGSLDPVSEDMLIGQAGKLEQYQWLIRAHLQNTSGELSTAGAESEEDAAAKASAAG